MNIHVTLSLAKQINKQQHEILTTITKRKQIQTNNTVPTSGQNEMNELPRPGIGAMRSYSSHIVSYRVTCFFIWESHGSVSSPC